MKSRSFFAEEVLQSSAMDCGPAALKCLLAGFDRRVDYDKLRELCHTGVDGTSIDALQDLALEIGLDASQHVVPADSIEVFLDGSRPFLAVVRTPYGGNHFAVVWNRVGRLVQVMDPTLGRRWLAWSDFLETLVVHEQPFPANGWLMLAAKGPYGTWLQRSLKRLGVPPGTLEARVEAEGWRGFAALDCAARIATRLRAASALRSSASISLALERAYERALHQLRVGHADPDALPMSLFAATGRDADHVTMRGAVVLVLEPRPAETSAVSGVGPEKAVASCSVLETVPRRPLRDLWAVVEGGLRPAIPVTLLAVLFATAGVLVEAVIFRSSFTIVSQFRIPLQGAAFAAMIAGFALALLAVEGVLALVMAWAGRYVEGVLRIATLERLPRLKNTFLRSRSVSDLAQRGQNIDAVRSLPQTLVALLRSTSDLGLTTAALWILDPTLRIHALVALGAALAVPFVARRVMLERDIRLLAHAGALTIAYLDALRGILPIRAHRAERAARIEHESLLVAWFHAAKSQEQLSLWITAAQMLTSTVMVIVLVFIHVAHTGEGQRLLLLLFWAVRLPAASETLAASVRALATARATLLRLQEPLRDGALAGVTEHEDRARQRETDRGIEVVLASASVVLGGHPILTEVTVTIQPGERVAIVGRSGAGKSSLVSVLLGWQELASGSATLDGLPVGDATLETLRSSIVWVDPAVHLWNRSLGSNIAYGAEDLGRRPMAEVVAQADLVTVLERLPRGLQTQLGESGGLVSGGEGQRVRFARGVSRRDARLVLLDEPFRGLDRERRGLLMGRVHELWPRATTLCVSHDVAETVRFERVLVIVDGRLVEDGRPEDLLARDSRYRALVEADREVSVAVWRDPSWRRVRMESGSLHEEAP
jgi:ABC-type bacteriocin/lantibiotic exporter with double-glycine peptidase domain